MVKILLGKKNFKIKIEETNKLFITVYNIDKFFLTNNDFTLKE